MSNLRLFPDDHLFLILFCRRQDILGGWSSTRTTREEDWSETTRDLSTLALTLRFLRRRLRSSSPFFVASGLQPPSLGSVAEAKLRPVNCCTQTWKELWPTQTYPMVMRLTPMLATMTLVFSWPWKAKSCAKRAIVVTEWPFLKLLCKRARMILEPYLPSIGKSPRDLRTKEMLVKQKRKCLLYHSVFFSHKRIKKIR